MRQDLRVGGCTGALVSSADLREIGRLWALTGTVTAEGYFPSTHVGVLESEALSLRLNAALDRCRGQERGPGTQG